MKHALAPLIAALFFVAQPCYAVVTVGFGQAGGGGECATQSTLLNQTGTFDGNLFDIDSSSKLYAFAITGNGKKLYSIKLKTGTAGEGSSTSANIYVSTSLNFGGSPLVSQAITTPGASSTEFTAIISSQPTLTNATTYYVGIGDSDSTWGTRFSSQMISDAAQNVYTSTTGVSGTFNQVLAGKSIWAEVKVCD